MTNKRKFAAILFVIAILGSMFSMTAFGIATEDGSVPAADGEAVVLMAAEDSIETIGAIAEDTAEEHICRA